MISGFENYRSDVSLMIGNKITDHLIFGFWKISYKIICPITFIVSHHEY